MFQLIAIALGFFVLKRIYGIFQMYKCVDDQAIKDYFDGRLKKKDKVLYEETIAHLGVCEKCQKRLESMAHDDEPGADEIATHLIE